MAANRTDYFSCGTLMARDVDLLSDDMVKVYRASHSHHPATYRRSEIVEAEPAVPKWRLPVNNLFG